MLQLTYPLVFSLSFRTCRNSHLLLYSLSLSGHAATHVSLPRLESFTIFSFSWFRVFSCHFFPSPLSTLQSTFPPSIYLNVHFVSLLLYSYLNCYLFCPY